LLFDDAQMAAASGRFGIARGFASVIPRRLLCVFRPGFNIIGYRQADTFAIFPRNQRSDGFHRQGPAIRAYPELAVKECALAQADKRILLADSSKLGAEGLYCFATFRDIDLLICDRSPDAQEQTRFPPGFTIITPES